MKKNTFKEPVQFANEFVESRYIFSALELDVFCRVVRHVQLSKQSSIELKFDVLESDAESKSHNAINEILRAFKNLLSNPVTIYDQDAQCYIMANVVSGVKVNKKTRRIHINMDPFLLPFLQNVSSKYTTIELSSLLKLRSMYAKRIYLMAAQFRASKVLAMHLDELRERLGLQNKYPVYADFKKRVIAPAMAQINEYTELQIDIADLEYNSRRIETITWTIANKNEYEAIVDDTKQIKWMIACGMSDWQIDNAYICKTPAELRPILYKAFLRFVDKNKPAVENKAAYLVTLLAREGINMRGAMPRQLAIPG